MADEPDAEPVDGPPLAWAVDVNGTNVRLKDLPLSTVLRIVEGEDTGATMMQLLAQPLADFAVAVKIADECAKFAGIDDRDKWLDDRLAGPWLDFTKLFVQVEDDLPTVVVDGVPPVGADG